MIDVEVFAIASELTEGITRLTAAHEESEFEDRRRAVTSRLMHSRFATTKPVPYIEEKKIAF